MAKNDSTVARDTDKVARDSHLMCDPCALDGLNELSMIHSSRIADVARAGEAITTIARLVNNSLAEPSRSNTPPLGAIAHVGLLNAMEIIGQYLEEVADRMNETATMHAAWNRGLPPEERSHVQ